jgi:hypothetical protein
VYSIFVAPRENMEEQSTQVRGTPNAEHLKAAQKKYKHFDDNTATKWQRLKTVNARKTLTPELNPAEHARWVHLCELKQKNA